MKQIVFYSWQSDLPNACNRGFVQDALEKSAASIAADESVTIEPVVDRDTQGVPGAPDIASTIFSKITAADVFVADVSITGRSEKRATPNPNVLIELGYAFKALGHEKVILVFNRAFGKIEELPFDLRMRRVLSYEMPQEEKQRSAEKKNLEKQLDIAIRAALENNRATRPTSPSIPALSAIESQLPNRIIILRRNLDEVLKKIDSLQPKKHSEGGTVEELVAALNSTQEVVAEFSKITEMISVMSDISAALEVQHWFGNIFQRYDLPENFSGRFSDADQDYFKFVGHELYVTFIGFLLKERRWEMLKSVLEEPIPMRYLGRGRGPGNADWKFASEHIILLINESKRRQRMSVHADMLNERHTTGGLAAIMPMEDFIAADYLLFLLGEMSASEPNGFMEWRPWSALFLKTSPLFLKSAEHKRIADQLMKLFQIGDAEEFRKKLAESSQRLHKLFGNGFWDNPIGTGDIRRFATR